jgi:hypothetical protein
MFKENEVVQIIGSVGDWRVYAPNHFGWVLLMDYSPMTGYRRVNNCLPQNLVKVPDVGQLPHVDLLASYWVVSSRIDDNLKAQEIRSTSKWSQIQSFLDVGNAAHTGKRSSLPNRM